MLVAGLTSLRGRTAVVLADDSPGKLPGIQEVSLGWDLTSGNSITAMGTAIASIGSGSMFVGTRAVLPTPL